MWDEIDFNDNLIRISAKRMKMARPHLVPMAKQVITIIKELHNIKTDSSYLFPSNTTSKRPIVAESLRGGLRRLGLSNEEMTTHGFRHMASTRLYEMGYKGDAIELQLAHSEGNKIKAAYNHAEHLEYRKNMMNEWADYLDGLEVDYEI
jgi:integrase